MCFEDRNQNRRVDLICECREVRSDRDFRDNRNDRDRNRNRDNDFRCRCHENNRRRNCFWW